ncbi:uroporphyrinogen-III C-methyltransferase [Haliea sp. E17]|uniref:uroporphyrinogen-III C-methyltransferase n=1 Tax=Haliea sp. E17 TaxID=3401576 RepID=UPI003AAD0720
MSDKENNSDPDTQAASDSAGAVSPAAQSETPAPSPTVPGATVSAPAAAAPAPQAKRSGGFIGWLALLLAVALGAAGSWIVMQGQAREQVLQQRLTSLENAAQTERQDIAAAETRLQASLQQSVGKLESAAAGRETAMSGFAQRLEQQQQLLDSFTANDKDSWLRAEAQYLLRLANQRVLMARDPQSAVALLQSADNILRELQDPGLHGVRAAVAAEIAALNAVPRVDVEGIYLRLSALIEQAGKLKIFEAPEIVQGSAVEPADDWKVRLRRGYEQAVEKLSQYIVIRRRDVPMQALMDPQWEGLVRQNLRMLLEQSQVALLNGNQVLYHESLERARHWVAQFADTDEAAAAAMDREISVLQQEVVAVEMPDLSRSVRELDGVIRQLPAAADAE